MSRLRRVIAPIAVTVVGLGALTGLQDTYFRDGLIEDALAAASQEALAEAGLDDVEVAFAGRDATLAASSEREAERAVEVVEAVRGVRVAVTEPAAEPSSSTSVKSAAPSPSPSTTPTPSPSPTPTPSPTAATPEEREQVQAQLVAFPAITFVTNSADLTPEGRATVEAAAAVLRANPLVTVTIEGHTDSVGNEEANLVLSQARAQTVLGTLVELGVPAERLSAQGFGETRPKVPDTTPENQAANRRVDLVVQQ